MFKYIKVVFKLFIPVFSAYFGWMIKYSRHPEKYDFELRFYRIQKLIRKVLRAFDVNVETIDMEELQNDTDETPNRFFAINHISDADPLIFIANAKRPCTFVSKKEVLKAPFVGRIIRILECECIDRKDLKQQLRSFKRIEKRLVENKNLDFIIFPEGTRNKGDVREVQEFHYGSFKPAIKTNTDILVFSLFGTHRIFNTKFHNKRNPVSVKLVKKFTPSDYKELTSVEVSSISYEACKKGVEELLDVDKNLMLTYNKRH